MGEELITLAVHTVDYANRLKDVLEFHGIPVTLEDVDSESLQLPVLPKKVRIPVSSLALGLKILESGGFNSEPLELIKMTGMGNNLLIPVDFSPLSMLAVKVGFFLAEKFGIEPIVMHAYIGASLIPNEVSSAIGIEDEDEIATVEAIEESADLRRSASQRLSKLKQQIKQAQIEGSVASNKFSTTLLEGIPEQVINDYCKRNTPLMVVMATRGAEKKGSDLIGSVTGEVIDSCRVPVLTIPENYTPGSGIAQFRNIAMFCTFTGIDMVLMRWLMRTFDYPSSHFHLLPANESPLHKPGKKIEEIRSYFSKIYPTASFTAHEVNKGKFDELVKEILEKNAINLIIVPNKKSSAFSRFFRPTLAHKILFEKDLPLLVIPV